MTVSISDRATALLSLKDERRELWNQAREISAKQMSLMSTIACEMLRLSGEHGAILSKMTALDETQDKLLNGVLK